MPVGKHPTSEPRDHPAPRYLFRRYVHSPVRLANEERRFVATSNPKPVALYQAMEPQTHLSCQRDLKIECGKFLGLASSLVAGLNNPTLIVATRTKQGSADVPAFPSLPVRTFRFLVLFTRFLLTK